MKMIKFTAIAGILMLMSSAQAEVMHFADILTVDTEKLANPNNMNVLLQLYIAHQLGSGPIATLKASTGQLKANLKVRSCSAIVGDLAAVVAAIKDIRTKLASAGLDFNLATVQLPLTKIKGKDGAPLILSFNNLDAVAKGTLALLNPRDKDGNLKPDNVHKEGLQKASDILGGIGMVLTLISAKVAKISTGEQKTIVTGKSGEKRDLKTLKNNAVLMMQKGTAVLAEVVNDCAAAARAGLTELEKSEKQATEEAEIEEAFEF